MASSQDNSSPLSRTIAAQRFSSLARSRVGSYARGRSGEPSSRIAVLCAFLADDDQSPVRRYTPVDADIDSVIDVGAIFQQDHRTLALQTMPALLLPRKGRYGLRDYEKMFCADLKSGHDIYDMRGIDRDKGCVVVARPDRYIAHVLPLDGFAELVAFFEGFMTDRHHREG
jgi:phenol 2-monooxygenase